MAFVPLSSSFVSGSVSAGLSVSRTCTIRRRPRPYTILISNSATLPSPLSPSSPPSSAPSSPSSKKTSKTSATSSSHSLGPYYAQSEGYLLSLGLSTEDARRCLSRLPKLSEISDLSSIAEPILSYLRNTLRLNRRQITQAVRFAPHIFFRDSTAFSSRLDMLQGVARVPISMRAGTIAKCPHVLWMDLENATAVVHTVIEACPLISPAALGMVFARVPQALVTSPERVRKNIARVREAGVCDSASMARVIIKAPLVLVYDTKKTIEKRLTYLANELELPLETLGKVLVATPQVLDWSVDKVLRPRMQLLTTIVGKDAVNGVVDKLPMILGVDDSIDRVLWLKDDLGLTDEQIRIIVREAPAVLTYSVVGNLAPKWAFLSETMGATPDDVVAIPREALCANLQQRAMPRYAFLASRGRTDVAVVDMLKGSDVEFCKYVAQCDPAQFREYVDNDTYLLFFSQLM